MAAWQAIAAFAILIVIVLVVWYLSNGFALPKQLTSTVSTTTLSSSNHVVNGTTSTSILYLEDCQSFSLFTASVNTSVSEGCTWTGGKLGLWVASGNSTYEKVTVVGADNVTYANQIAEYQCTTFYENFTAPAQRYFVTLTTGPQSNNTNLSCPRAFAILNQTLSPPKHVVYPGYVYNGNFSNGAYTGWNVTGAGFGTHPLNISVANMPGNITCYKATPFTNYVGPYFATTYNCGTSVSPGNLTSSTFVTSKAFLNFKIISPDDNFLYVEILVNNTPELIAHYNTFNLSLYSGAQTGNAFTVFKNASMPLVGVVGQPIQVRVVADTLTHDNYIAVGDFAVANRPVEDRGILVNLSGCSLTLSCP